jgi:hypothetical protein
MLMFYLINTLFVYFVVYFVCFQTNYPPKRIIN